MLQMLFDCKLIRGIDSEALEIPSLYSILGASTAMEFCGREVSVEHILQSIEISLRDDTGRSSIMCLSGCAGVGKTRTCVEIGELCVQNQYLVLAVTFNNNHSIQNKFESQFFQSEFHCHVPILMRLLHAYGQLPEASVAFDIWAPTIYLQFGLDLANLNPLLTLEYLRRLYCHEGPLLLIVDEMLMPWNSQLCDGEQTWQMMKRFYGLQRAKHQLAVLFSTLDNTCLDNFVKNPQTGRNFDVTSLTPLDPILTHSIFSTIPISDELLSGFNKSREQLQIQLILNFGTVPRITEFCISVLSGLKKSISFNELLERVSALIIQRYRCDLPLNLVYRCIFGIPTRPDEVFESSTVMDAVRHAYLFYDPLTQIPRMLPHQLFVQSVMHEKVPLLLQLLTTPRHTAHNIFEEAYRIHRLIFATTNNPTHVSQIFTPSIPFGKFIDLKIDQNFEFDQRIWTYANPPTPSDVSEMGSVHEHQIWIPRDSFEPGIDSVMFLRLETKSKNSSNQWLAVGIQNKWSKSPDEKISAPDLRGAEFRFRSRFLFRGWKKQNLLFVVVIRRHIPQYMAYDTFNGRQTFVGPTLIISTDVIRNHGTLSNFDRHLGPTFVGLLEQFYTFPPQSLNYLAGDNLDAANLYTKANGWTVFETRIAKKLGYLLPEDPTKTTE
jgi:hypothetical protein